MLRPGWFFPRRAPLGAARRDTTETQWPLPPADFSNQPRFCEWGSKFVLARRGGPDLPVPGRRGVLRAFFLLSPRGLAQSFWAGRRISQLRRLLPESMEIRDRLCHPTTGGSSPPSADSPSTAKCASLEPLQAPPRFPPPATATSMQAATGGFPQAAGPNRRDRFLLTEEPPERGDPWHRTSR